MSDEQAVVIALMILAPLTFAAAIESTRRWLDARKQRRRHGQ